MLPFIVSATIATTTLPTYTSQNMPVLTYEPTVEDSAVLPIDEETLVQNGIATTTIDLNVLDLIKQTFGKDTPLMIKIAYCESGLREFNSDGSVLHGIEVHDDIGLFQINLDDHGEEALDLGLDLNTVEGNIQFTKVLFDKSGTNPWIPSRKCWNKEL